MWVGVNFYGSVWVGVNFLWVGVGWCELFMCRYGSVWVGVTFLWVGVGWRELLWVGAQNDITNFTSFISSNMLLNI